MTPKTTVIILIGLLLLAVVFLLFYYFFVRTSLYLWFRSIVTGAKVSLFDIAFMRLQRFSNEEVSRLIELIIRASKAGIRIDTDALASHILAGGNAERVILAMIEAHQAKLGLTFDLASAIDLSGKDVRQAVRWNIEPLILETPAVSSVAKDGVQLIVKARVAMRANINHFIGGMTEQTILARVGTGIVAAIGYAQNHQDIIANPAQISQHIMSIDRDEDNVSDIHQDTAFWVLSIDMTKVEPGTDLGAQLQSMWEDARTRIAQAKSETARAQEVTKRKVAELKIMEMEMLKIKAKAEVPRAIADAIRNGKLGAKEYFQVENLNADTQMRQAFSLLTKKQGKK